MTVWILMGAVCITALVVMIPACCLSGKTSREEEKHGSN